MNNHLRLLYLCHQSQTIGRLEIESRTNLLDKGLGILEIFGMLIIGPHHVGTVVVVCLALLVGIGNVEGNPDAEVIGSILILIT